MATTAKSKGAKQRLHFQPEDECLARLQGRQHGIQEEKYQLCLGDLTFINNTFALDFNNLPDELNVDDLPTKMSENCTSRDSLALYWKQAVPSQ